MTNTDNAPTTAPDIDAAREAYAARLDAADIALVARLNELDPAARADINGDASREAFRPYYAEAAAARREFDAVRTAFLRFCDAS